MASLLEIPDRAVADEALGWPDRAKAVVIIGAETYQTACGLLLGIKDLRKKIADTFDPHVSRAFEAHRALVKEKRDAEAPLTQAEQILKQAIGAYDREQERLRQEEQRRIDEAAKKQAEDEAIERAAALELEGNEFGDAAMVEEARAIIDAPIQPAPLAPAVKMTPKVQGVTLRKTFAFRIVNPALVPAQYRVIDESKIRGVVRSLGLNASIPGVQVFEETSVAAGRR